MCETKIILMALMAKGIIDYSIVVYCSFIVNIKYKHEYHSYIYKHNFNF